MIDRKMVEVRFDCGLHDLKEEQALGLLRDLSAYEPIVGLGFDDKAAVILEVDEPDVDVALAAAKAETVAAGLTVAHTQTMTLGEYEAAAWGEVDLDE